MENSCAIFFGIISVAIIGFFILRQIVSYFIPAKMLQGRIIEKWDRTDSEGSTYYVRFRSDDGHIYSLDVSSSLFHYVNYDDYGTATIKLHRLTAFYLERQKK